MFMFIFQQMLFKSFILFHVEYSYAAAAAGRCLLRVTTRYGYQVRLVPHGHVLSYGMATD